MAAGRLDRHRVKRDVDDVRAEELDRLKNLRPVVGVGADLNEHELALHCLRRLKLDDLDDVDQLVELLGPLLKRMLLAVHHDCHPGNLLVLGRADRERLDVEAASGEQARDADQDAWLVLDKDRESVLLAHSVASHSGAMSRACLMSSLLVPAATIGQTIASLWTMKSITTGWSLMAIACSMTESTSSLRSQRSPMHP